MPASGRFLHVAGRFLARQLIGPGVSNESWGLYREIEVRPNVSTVWRHNAIANPRLHKRDFRYEIKPIRQTFVRSAVGYSRLQYRSASTKAVAKCAVGSRPRSGLTTDQRN